MPSAKSLFKVSVFFFFGNRFQTFIAKIFVHTVVLKLQVKRGYICSHYH